ncbi:ABC transporter substrate-binding protein [Methyloligella sp. 2.7D]|uniref:ABC transporter substrate-binding protein n=1 Tax=unclassified Methyloligella TaxID=2625955 RepID=UPI001FEE9B58|nr:ABC transporter substrate-binding protein [Methyloligella sp. GL2]
MRIGWLIGVCLAVLFPVFAAQAADEAKPQENQQAGQREAQPEKPAEKAVTEYPIVYLGKTYPEPIPLSLLDQETTEKGIDGARLAIAENNRTGSFLGKHFSLEEHRIAPDADIREEAKKLFDEGRKLIVADLEPEDLLALADMPEASDALILDIRTHDDTLRQQQCRANVFHILPSDAMRTDALAQYLIWKKWDRWFLLKGTAPTDIAYAKAVKRAARRFGGDIVEERSYKFEAGNNRADSGHQQIQTQMPAATQAAADHDVLWVADTVEGFGEYLPYRVYTPKPVVGTQGLVATAWHRSYEEYAGTQLQDRFERAAHRWMTERDYGGWLAVRAIGEAATRSPKSDPADLRAYMLSDAFTVAGFKGRGMSFRPWNNQLRQPILIAGPRSLVSTSPQEGFLHPNHLTDTLGFDKLESKCSFAGN